MAGKNKRIDERRQGEHTIVIDGKTLILTTKQLLGMPGWKAFHGKYKGYDVHSLHALRCDDVICITDGNGVISKFKIPDLAVALKGLKDMVYDFEVAVAPV
jgi:hypothetical protein